jgi:hypothetical protein
MTDYFKEENMNKSLSNKAIDLKGKKYVLVSDRILYFNETYPDGAIECHLISEPDADMVVMQAVVTPDAHNPMRSFTGYSQAKWGDGFVNKTSAIENCETSAVGRALGMMGIGVIDSIASIDEIKKAELPTYAPNKTGDKTLNVLNQSQRNRIRELCVELEIPLSADDMEEFKGICQSILDKDAPRTVGEAEIIISVLETKLQDKVVGL